MKNTIAVRVTRLESFRRYRDEQDFEQSAKMCETLVQDIINPALPTRKMQMGTAFHAVLANPEEYKWNAGEHFYYAHGFGFPSHVIESAMQHIDYSGLFEIATHKTYSIDDTDFLVTGTCDHILGTIITDFKTRWFEGTEWSVWDDNQLRETYESSYQWRLYLDMFDCDMFRYLIVAMRDRSPIELVNIKRDIICHAYKQMRRDIDDLLYDFRHFVKIHKLQEHLQVTERETRIIAEAFA